MTLKDSNIRILRLILYDKGLVTERHCSVSNVQKIISIEVKKKIPVVLTPKNYCCISSLS